jgi:hypothetical protein
VEITELPIKTWTQTYKEKVIEPMFDGSEKNKPQLLQDYKEYHTDTTVHFICRLKPEDMEAAERKGLHDVFFLKSSINTSNMVIFYIFIYKHFNNFRFYLMLQVVCVNLKHLNKYVKNFLNAGRNYIKNVKLFLKECFRLKVINLVRRLDLL